MPTFRDVETGLWAKVDPYEISSSEGWQANPERVWAWYLWRHYMMESVAPNNGHRAVAAWQDFAEVHVVTQNVDNLHERAGSKNVYHLHGSLFEFRCDRCQSAYTAELPAMAEPVEAVDPPRCAVCGGLIRPNVVWFGEALPDDAWQRSIDAVGSSRPRDRGRHIVDRLSRGGATGDGAGQRQGGHRGEPRAHATVRRRDGVAA